MLSSNVAMWQCGSSFGSSAKQGAVEWSGFESWGRQRSIKQDVRPTLAHGRPQGAPAQGKAKVAPIVKTIFRPQ
jgi:hypothetical protein